MTIPVSTVPSAISAILNAVNTQVAGDSADPPILVCVGEPSTDDPNDIIEIGRDIRRAVTEASMVGSGGQWSLEEEYDIDVVVSCAMETVDTQTGPLALLDRAWQLVGYVETAIRTDPSLGGAVVEAFPASTTGGEAVWSANGVGRIDELTIAIRCVALI